MDVMVEYTHSPVPTSIQKKYRKFIRSIVFWGFLPFIHDSDIQGLLAVHLGHHHVGGPVIQPCSLYTRQAGLFSESCCQNLQLSRKLLKTCMFLTTSCFLLLYRLWSNVNQAKCLFLSKKRRKKKPMMTTLWVTIRSEEKTAHSVFWVFF